MLISAHRRATQPQDAPGVAEALLAATEHLPRTEAVVTVRFLAVRLAALAVGVGR